MPHHVAPHHPRVGGLPARPSSNQGEPQCPTRIRRQQTGSAPSTLRRGSHRKPEEGHPAKVGGEVVRIGEYDKNGTRARIYTIRTAFQEEAPVQSPHWAIWAFAPQPGQNESRMTRLLNELNLVVGDHILASFAGRKPFTDGSGKTWLDYTFVRIDPGEEPPAEPQFDEPPHDPADDFGEVPL